MGNLIKDLEELASHLPWGTLDRGETPMTDSGNRLPYGIETIAMAISELKKYEELKKKISDGRLVELPYRRPCKEGDKYYIVDVKKQKVFEGEISYVNYDKNYGYICQFSWYDCPFMVPSILELFGKSFNEQLSYYDMYKKQAEAEAKLKELKGE